MQADPSERSSGTIGSPGANEPLIDDIDGAFSDGESSLTADQWIDLEEASLRRFKRRGESETELSKIPLLADLLPLGIGMASLAAIIAATESVDFIPQQFPLVFAFVMGYAAIILEETLLLNKSGSALLMGMMCWSLVGHATGLPPEQVLAKLNETISSVSQIIFFLLGAMAIVETVDAHQGFSVVTDQIKTNDRRTLLILIALITFFMSAVLDNLTTTIVMCSLLARLAPKSDPEFRNIAGGLIVIAANAGGAWSPIGDVTTTMLWIGGDITVAPLVSRVFLPSLACLGTSVAVSLASVPQSGEFKRRKKKEVERPRGSSLVFWAGTAGLLFVPVFKTVTHLPPFAGILLSLGALWTMTDRLHGEERPELQLPSAMRRIDTPGTLFFLGILMAVGALEAAGTLDQLSHYVSATITDERVVAGVIGVVSAVIDNVPLVAAAMGMYDLTHYPVDSEFWDLIALCAGTGGSILVIGSAAGVAYMGMENVSFAWYLKNVTPSAAAGYVAGITTLLVQNKLLALLGFGGAAAATVASTVALSGISP